MFTRSAARLAATIALLLLIHADASSAQASLPRVAVSLTPAWQATSSTASEAISFEAYSETGTLTARYTTDRQAALDGGVTVRVWHRVAIAALGSYLHGTPAAQVNALVPHPYAFNQLRPISGAPEVTHSELALHVDAVYWLRHTDRVDVLVSGGPSVIRTDQDFVSDVMYSQSDPFDTASYTGATLLRERATAIGGNAGIEAAWAVAAHLGITGMVRYSRATADFSFAGAPPTVVGGLHLGGGIRVAF